MSLVSLILILVIIGVVLWAIESLIPMNATIKKLIEVVIVIAVLLWILQSFGVLHGVGNIRL